MLHDGSIRLENQYWRPKVICGNEDGLAVVAGRGFNGDQVAQVVIEKALAHSGFGVVRMRQLEVIRGICVEELSDLASGVVLTDKSSEMILSLIHI